MKLYNNLFLSFFALVFIYGCGGGSDPLPSAADPTFCNSINMGDEKYKQFLCKGSEITRKNDRTSDANQWDNWCPPQAKYGHNFVLVDSTEGYEEEQYSLLLNQMLAEQNIDIIGPYDKISIMNIAGRGMQATELKPIFNECKPRSGKDTSMYPIDKWVDPGSTPRKMSLTSGEFMNLINSAGDEFSNLGNTKGAYSQIMEQIKELSRNSTLDFGSNYQYRKIIVFSDLMQFSDKMDLISSCRDKKKCISYEDLKSNYSERLWEDMKPNFGTNPPEVFVYYLQCRHDQDLDIGLLEIWESYFAEIGVSMTYDIETSCEDIFKEEDPTS